MKRYYFAISLLIVVSCYSCQPVEGTMTLSPANTVKPSDIYSPLLSITQTPTIQPTSTHTSTAQPTLEPEQAEETILKLLTTPSECSDPCFWGIIPGVTTYSEAEKTLSYLAIIPSLSTVEIGTQYHDYRYFAENLPFLGVLLAVQDEIVKNITVWISPSEYQGVEAERNWKAFSPETFIQQYGTPSKVSLIVDFPPEPGFPPNTGWYTMIMKFDRSDIIYSIESSEITVSAMTQVCPLADDIQNIRIFYGVNPENPPFDLVPLEEITTLDLHGFSELMLNERTEACFDLNTALIP